MCRFMKKYFVSIITGERKSLIATIIRLVLQILSLGYLLGWVTKRVLYKTNISPTYKLPVKIICIGNITWGGTGKSVTVIKLAQDLVNSSKKVAVVSRGYMHKKSAENITLVSDGKTVLCNDPTICGDEPLMLSHKLLSIPIAVSGNRYEVGQFIIKKFNPDIIIMDDGYQHWQLYRNLDIVCVDSSVWLGTQHVLPAGILREPLNSLKHAGLVNLTHIDLINTEQLRQWEQLFKRVCPDVPVVYSKHKIAKLRRLISDKEVTAFEPKETPVILLSAVGNNAGFFTSIKSAGFNIINHYKFMDHHWYAKEDLYPCIKRASELNTDIITTEKDAVKIKNLGLQSSELDKFVIAEIELEIVKEQDLWDKKVQQVFG